MNKSNHPPKKKLGQATGPRTIKGAILDVHALAREWGITENTVRSRVARHLIPFRRWGGRVVFIRGELDSFLKSLPGVSTEEALNNHEERQK